ncbi:MAG TPA: protease inhibitor I42 family protein [Anaerolineaceae bacterium]|nr:protease inhibitor I42 family protein [Anaerolineaceae bacterium]
MKKYLILVSTLISVSLLFTACADIAPLNPAEQPDAGSQANENPVVAGESGEVSPAGEDVFNPAEGSGQAAPQAGADDSAGPGNVNEVGIMVVTPSPTGNTVTVNVGDLLIVELPTIPVEGWSWVAVDPDASMLVQQGDAALVTGTDAANAGGITRLTFLAMRPGSTTLLLEYRGAVGQDPSQELPPGMTSASYSFSVTIKGENKVVVVQPAIRGVSATLKVGDTLVVEIPTIPAPGWTWVPEDLNTKVLEQVGQAEYTAGTAANDAGGIFCITFRAVGKGNISLTLIYLNTPIQEPGQAGPSLSAQSFGMSVIVE